MRDRYDRVDEINARAIAGNRGEPWHGIKAGDQIPRPPEPQFSISGASLWPFDRRRAIGPWSERTNADVYGQKPAWARRISRNAIIAIALWFALAISST